MIDVDSVLREIALRTSRRAILTRAGRALIGASLLTVVRAESALALACNSCANPNDHCSDGTTCGNKAASWSDCCSGPDSVPACNPGTGTWCGGNPWTWDGSCLQGYASWFWYCCYYDHETGTTYLYRCQDCCINQALCTTRHLQSVNC
jgi:hypothetical protein